MDSPLGKVAFLAASVFCASVVNYALALLGNPNAVWLMEILGVPL